MWPARALEVADQRDRQATPPFLRLYRLALHTQPSGCCFRPSRSCTPTEPHYYLEFLGHDPAHQGKGIGSALMQPVLDRCDEEGWRLPGELEGVERPPSMPRHGFAVNPDIEHNATVPTCCSCGAIPAEPCPTGSTGQGDQWVDGGLAEELGHRRVGDPSRDSGVDPWRERPGPKRRRRARRSGTATSSM